jgi:hypothetical protein
MIFREYQIDLAILFGSQLSRSDIDRQMALALEFEYKLANVRTSLNEPKFHIMNARSTHNRFRFHVRQEETPISSTIQ